MSSQGSNSGSTMAKQFLSGVDEMGHLYNLFMQAPAIIAVLRGPDHVFELANPRYMQLIGVNRKIIGRTVREALPEVEGQGFFELLDNVYRTGKPFVGNEVPLKLDTNQDGILEEVFVNFVYQPAFDAKGNVYGILAHGVDVTEQVKARLKIQESEEKYRTLFETMDQGFCMVEVLFDENNYPVDYRFFEVNPMFEKQTGLKDAVGKTARQLVPDLEEYWFEIYGKVALTGEAISCIEASPVMSRWFEVYAFRIGGSESRKVAVLFTDITGRKQAEEALQKSEQRFRLAMNAADLIGTWDWHIQTDLVYSDAQFSAMFSIDPEKGKQGAPISEYFVAIHPEDVEPVSKAIQHTVDTGEKYVQEYRLVQKDGSIRWVIARGECLYNADGKPWRFPGAAVDITERKNAEEALKESEERFSSIFNQTSVGIAQTDLTGKFVLVNDRYCQIVGRSREQLYNCRMQDITHPVDLKENLYLLEQLFKDGVSFTIEKRYLHADGFDVWVNNNVSLIKDQKGNPRYITAVSHDITKQKEAEKALKESEAKFRRFYESNMLPIAFWNVQGYVYECNEAFALLLGYTQDEIAAGKFSWVESTSPQYRYLHEEGVKKAIEGQVFVDPYEVEMQRKDGSKITIIVGYTMLEGSKENGVAFLLDVTEQKGLMTQLEKRVEERTKELQSSNEDLQQFAHVASHDLREPVRKIKIFANKLKDEAWHLLNERSKTYLEKVFGATDRMSIMIDGVLTYSTINASEQKIEDIDLNKIWKDIEDDLEVIILQKDAIINCEVLPRIEGAQVLIYQLFYNLLNNSLKFSKPDTRPVISITSETVSIEGVGYAKLLLADNGIGFDPEHGDRIFDTFIRLNPKDKYEGTGLGLALCKKIVERHKGKIKANGERGKGAVFTIHLPLKQTNRLI